jgi:oligoendopeptidase F
MDRNTVEPKYKWKLEDIFPTDEEWESEFKKLEDEFCAIETIESDLTKSAAGLAASLKKIDEMSLSVERLFVYARMRRDEDNANGKYQAMTDRAMGLSVRLSSALAFVNPTLLAMDENTLRSWAEKTEGLADYRFMISDLLRQKKHVLGRGEERLLAMASDFASGAHDIFTMLNNADLTFGDVNGKPLTHGSYIVFMQDEDREVRKKAYETYYQTYKNNINTIAAAYSTSVKKDIFYAEARGYESALQKSLFGDDVPVSLYENLIKIVQKNLFVLHKYVDLKKRLLGIPEIRMYDIYAPLVPALKNEYSYEQARGIVLDGLAPLGEDYAALLSKAFSKGWIDVYESKGKTSGAYSWGVYGVHPYVLLNHRGDLDSVFTIAHELGHAMHSYYSSQTQPYATSGYTIFVAEVASTVNEILLTHHLLQNSPGDLRKYILNHYLDQFRTTVIRQTMFAEFEKITYEMSAGGKPLTPESLCRAFGELNQTYYGPGMTGDDIIPYEWSRIPHFYNAFYVYKYATGFSAAVQIAQNIMRTGDATAYREFLTTGGSDYPLRELLIAQVDLKEGGPVEACMQAFDAALSEFEKTFSN